jgi:hypothetical protein
LSQQEKHMTTTALADLAPAFIEMAHRIVWCVAATTDRDGNPSTRVLHPIWEWDGEHLDGWILTSPLSPKAAHIDSTPRLSITYWAPSHDTCTASCRVEWDNSDEGRSAGWVRFAEGPPPVGYDPSIVPLWTSPSVPEFGVLHLTPQSLRVMPGTVMLAGEGELLRWRA